MDYTTKTYPVTDGKKVKSDKSKLGKESTDVLMEKRLLDTGGAVIKEPVKAIAQPLGDRVIVRRIQEQQKGLIIIPGAKRENSDMGKVVAVGPGRFGEAMTVVVGDEVLFPKNGVMEIEIDEEAMVMMRESDIHAIL